MSSSIGFERVYRLTSLEDINEKDASAIIGIARANLSDYAGRNGYKAEADRIAAQLAPQMGSPRIAGTWEQAVEYGDYPSIEICLKEDGEAVCVSWYDDEGRYVAESNLPAEFVLRQMGLIS